MVGFNGSPTACRAVAWAIGHAHRQGARLVVVHVSDIPMWAALVAEFGLAWQATLSERDAGIEKQAHAALEKAGFAWEYLHRVGHPVDQLARTADVIQADAVVVGASRRSTRLIGRSVAGRLLRSRHWPVIVVP